MRYKQVGVLRGGPSPEYSVSMETGKIVLSALKELGYNTKDIVVDRHGGWLVEGFVRKPEEVLSTTDVVFVTLSGGEEVVIQRLLDRLRIPYTGSGPYATAVTLNKFLTKEHLKGSPINLPRHMRLSRDGVSDVVKTALGINDLFGPHYLVKPVSGGSSIGTLVVDNPVELAGAIGDILSSYEEVLVEERILGKEVMVGVLDNFRGSSRYVLPEVEVVLPTNAKFYSADLKRNGGADIYSPGSFSKAQKADLAEAALYVHDTFNLQQLSRSDFMVSPAGIYFLEVNTVPQIAPGTPFVTALEAVGIKYPEVLEKLIETANCNT